jgi:hypothetical protein
MNAPKFSLDEEIWMGKSGIGRIDRIIIKPEEIRYFICYRNGFDNFDYIECLENMIEKRVKI